MAPRNHCRLCNSDKANEFQRCSTPAGAATDNRGLRATIVNTICGTEVRPCTETDQITLVDPVSYPASAAQRLADLMQSLLFPSHYDHLRHGITITTHREAHVASLVCYARRKRVVRVNRVHSVCRNGNVLSMCSTL